MIYSNNNNKNKQKRTIMVECDTCRGKGYIKCESCGGDGHVYWPGYEGKTRTCSECHGRGTVECPDCRGWKEVEKEVEN